MTSNPSIFEKAMGHGTNYDAGFKELAAKGDVDAQTIYETLAIQDIQHAADLLRPVYEATNRVDGYVSLEVSPYLALRTDETVAEARRLWKLVGRDNLMVKVPGTDEGTPAIKTLIGEGMNINVTLLFSQQAYKDVAEAFIAGLEDFKSPAATSAGWPAWRASSSAASTRRSTSRSTRWRRWRRRAGAEALRGKVAIANAKMAYQHYLSLIGSDRWKALAAPGAMPQRLLWASTGVKDKAYQRYAVRRGADRPRHGQHDAAGHDGCLPRPRPRQGSADRRRGGREGDPGHGRAPRAGP